MLATNPRMPQEYSWASDSDTPLISGYLIFILAGLGMTAIDMMFVFLGGIEKIAEPR